MPDETIQSQKILAQSSLRGIDPYIHLNEAALLTIPAIWDNGQSQKSRPCEIVLTDQRLLGFFRSRRETSVEEFALEAIQTVTFREKQYEPIFRELLVSDGVRRVFIRAPKKKLEELYIRLQATLKLQTSTGEAVTASKSSPTFERENLSTASYESSSAGLTMLLGLGIAMECLSLFLCTAAQNLQAAAPLFIVGFMAVCLAFIIRRRRTT